MTDKDKTSTIPRLLFEHYDLLSTLTAVVINRHGQRRRYKWREYYENTSQVCLGLIAVGLKRGEIVVFLGENEPERMWVEMAVWSAGGAVAIIPPEATNTEIEQICREVGARFVFAGGEDEAHRLAELKSRLPEVERIVCWDRRGVAGDLAPDVIDIASIMGTGRKQAEDNYGAFLGVIEQGTEDDIAVVVYRRGDAVLERGVRISQRALMASARGFVERCPLKDDDLLAANHAAGSTTDYLFSFLPHMLGAIRLEFPQQPATNPDAAAMQTTFIMRQAEEWTAMGRDITSDAAGNSSLRRKLMDFFLPVGPALAATRRAVSKIGGMTVFRGFRAGYGLRKIRFAASGSGFIDEASFGAIHAIGVDLRRSYFTAETGLICMQGSGESDPNAVGRPVNGTEVRIAADGSLLVRGGGFFAGYQGDNNDAASLTEKGWWRTGDTGSISQSGQVVLSGLPLRS